LTTRRRARDVGDVPAVLELLLVQHAELVALADVEREVDVPSRRIWFASVMIRGRLHARLLAGGEQRRLDARALADDLGLERFSM